MIKAQSSLTPGISNISTNNLELITEIPIAESQFPIDYGAKILSIGSCFAENMADKFDYFQFQNSVNPFGIVFHPLAIEKCIGFATDGKQFSAADIFFHNERWHCFDAHSDLSHPDQTQLLQNLNNAADSTKRGLADATHIIITLGTAWVYRHISSGKFVANCHKVPQKEFSKVLLPVNAIAESLKNVLRMIAGANASAKIILTVSPVRHIKDGFAENQRSKAHLITAVHGVLDEQANHQNPVAAHYFPSYEIMMDELRDYRFYTEDMLHPSQIAIDYIWEKFSKAWISSAAFGIMAEVANIRKALAHRPFNADSDSHKNFLKTVDAKVEKLRQEFPHITF